MDTGKRVIVVGAGIGGLSAAARLANAGFAVTVLEAHVYPGGCAGTFYHQGYRFDAGATLSGGFYPGGPMELLGQAAGIEAWPGRPAEPVMQVHLPDGTSVPRLGSEARWETRRQAFGENSLDFWRWQEEAANRLWELALGLPPWPPQGPADLYRLLRSGMAELYRSREGTVRLAMDALRPVSAHLQGASERLRLFVDAQLLISAQATSRQANALYGAAALDLPRRGVFHLEGGTGTIAERLVGAIKRHGGLVLYRQQVQHIRMKRGQAIIVETVRGETFPADLVVANLPPWNIAALLGDQAPARLRRLQPYPVKGWGAFVVYLGIDGSAVPPDSTLHHQVISSQPLGEGNTIFLSLSPAWDSSRAPAGRRALTVSTHTNLEPWWTMYEKDQQAYQAKVAQYTEKIFVSAGQVIPELRQAVELILPGTPVTFQKYTGRLRGWVGGFPQTSLFQNWGACLAPGLWMVGDSIFPGQSVAAAALGGLRVADRILQENLSVDHFRKSNFSESGYYS